MAHQLLFEKFIYKTEGIFFSTIGLVKLVFRGVLYIAVEMEVMSLIATPQCQTPNVQRRDPAAVY